RRAQQSDDGSAVAAPGRAAGHALGKQLPHHPLLLRRAVALPAHATPPTRWSSLRCVPTPRNSWTGSVTHGSPGHPQRGASQPTANPSEQYFQSFTKFPRASGRASLCSNVLTSFSNWAISSFVAVDLNRSKASAVVCPDRIPNNALRISSSWTLASF